MIYPFLGCLLCPRDRTGLEVCKGLTFSGGTWNQTWREEEGQKLTDMENWENEISTGPLSDFRGGVVHSPVITGEGENGDSFSYGQPGLDALKLQHLRMQTMNCIFKSEQCISHVPEGWLWLSSRKLVTHQLWVCLWRYFQRDWDLNQRTEQRWPHQRGWAMSNELRPDTAK